MSRVTLYSLALLFALTTPPTDAEQPLPAPATGKIRVAFLLAPGATVIDFAGPWEVFQDVHVPERGDAHDEIMPFDLYTVAASREIVRATAGMQIVPDYTFDDAPQPDVIVVPALRGSAPLHAWLRKASAGADIVMSVCTGAFQLGEAGLLDSLRATTHHRFLDAFAERFPNVELERGVRWVDNGSVATAAGLTSGIDLALHVVARYFGEEIAAETAEFMEHASRDWMTPEGGERRTELGEGRGATAGGGQGGEPAPQGGTDASSRDEPPLALGGLDPVLLLAGREIAGSEDLGLVFEGLEYRFASEAQLGTFWESPERFAVQLDGACAAMPGSGRADPSIFTVHEGRIYVFGSVTCREHFIRAPERFVARHTAESR